MDPEASYLITFRDNDDGRLSLLNAVVAWLAGLPNLEVIIVEQHDSPRIDPRSLPGNSRTRFVYNDGPFNKAWGLNVAAKLATRELIVIGDADMVMSGGALGRALAVCRDHYDAVNPYSNLVDLTESETRSVLEGGLDPEGGLPGRSGDRRPQGEFVCFCGGICVFRRAVYLGLGGMDERFQGWGGEDDAMSIALARHTSRLAVQTDTMAWHLWHPRPPERYHHPSYRRNRELAERYRTCSREELVRQYRERRVTMGNPERYRPS